jgi:hypothetical protein
LIQLVACNNQQSRAHEQPHKPSLIHTLRNVVASAHGQKNPFQKIILRAAGIEPQSTVRSTRWSYRITFSRRTARAATIKLIVASRRALCKREVKFL